MSTRKPGDDGRNERQREQHESEQLLHDKPADFIERTKPEDRLSEGGGQLTRDNVNPAIPSAEPGTGGIVDTASLGMPQASGAARPATPQGIAEQTVNPPDGPVSINEPPGSDVVPDAPPTTPPPPTEPAEDEPLPSHSELERLTRAELDDLAAARGVDVSDASNKQDVIDALQKDERRRKRRS